MAEMGALIITAMLLGAAFGVGWIIGMVIRRIRGVDDPERQEKKKAKEQRREEKRNRRGLVPNAWQKGRFPPRVPGGQPMRMQEPQQPPNQNIYLFFGPRGGSANSQEPEDDDPRTGRGTPPGSYGPGGMFPGGGRGG
jgi:hypothetical protein